MLREQQIFCCRFPAKTVALSFDDGPGETRGPGPGPRTLELGQYLADEGIAAAFFVIGERALAYPEIIKGLKHQGHLIGNHTMSHAQLDVMIQSGDDAGWQILETNRLISHITGEQGPILFRAPWGRWEPAMSVPLSRDMRLKQSVGPIAWDVPLHEGDWYYWDKELSPEQCAKAYFDEIQSTGGRGIIDLHDHSFEDGLWQKNRTFEMVKLLVPMLKKAGYHFVRLDEVPEIREALAQAA